MTSNFEQSDINMPPMSDGAAMVVEFLDDSSLCWGTHILDKLIAIIGQDFKCRPEDLNVTPAQADELISRLNRTASDVAYQEAVQSMTSH